MKKSMEKIEEFFSHFRWLYRPTVIAVMTTIAIGVFRFLPNIVDALNNRTFTTIEKRIITEQHVEDLPTPVEVYKQQLKHDSIMIKFLNMKDSLFDNMQKLDTITQKNAVTIYQMKKEQKLFFEKVLERLFKE